VLPRAEPPLGAVFLPLQEEVVVLAMALFQPRSAGQAEDRAGQRAYEASVLLTDLDRLNRSKGSALYQSDSYGKFKVRLAALTTPTAPTNLTALLNPSCTGSWHTE
jgi:hypothetical protein